MKMRTDSSIKSLQSKTWAAEKTRLLEALLYVSARLQQDAERGFFDDIDIHLQRRSDLLKQMADMDRQLSPKDWLKTPSAQSEMWTRQLQEMQRRDEEVKKHIRKQQNEIQSDLRICARDKQTLLDEFGIIGKGVRFQSQA